MVEQYSRTVILPWWSFSFVLYIFQFLKGTLGALGSFIYLFIYLYIYFQQYLDFETIY